MKLLGIIIIDSKLNFEDQNLSLCHEASIQLNALIAFEMYGKKNVNYDFFFFFVSILFAPTHVSNLGICESTQRKVSK